MKKYIKQLEKMPFFSGLNEIEILSTLEILSPVFKEYQKGSFILSAGDCTKELGLLISGSLLIVQEDIWGYRNIMNKLPAGTTFAEPFATSKIPLNITIEANEDCVVLLFDLQKIISPEYLDKEIHTKIIQNLITILARKTFNLNEKISYMNKRSTRGKLLSYLSAQSQKQGSFEFDIPFNRQQLADYLCVERSAMTVELSKLQKEGILTTNRNHFILHIS